MSNPILSIVIPTRNRYEYLYYSLFTILKYYKEQNIEVIVNDNSTDEMPSDLYELIKSNQIFKYYKIEGWYSQVGNFENAFGLVSGKYLTMIGDDDSVSNNLLEVVEYMENNKVDALNCLFATYLWPDIESKIYSKNLSGTLSIPNYSKRFYKIDTQKEIQKVLHVGGTSLENLPRLYYGIVLSSVLNKVKNDSGVFFPGPSPDMANAFSLSFYVKNQVFYDFPLFVAGNSSKSAAGMGAKGAHLARLEDISILPKECSSIWEKLNPKFWSGPTIWAESAIKAIISCDKDEMLKNFNYIRLYAACKVYNSQYNILTEQAEQVYLNSNGIGMTTYAFRYYIEVFKIWNLRLKALLKNSYNILKIKLGLGKSNYSDILNVYLATEIMINKIK
jgi:glycosyltransferase involved in cell wall biosynthesis